MKRLFVGLQALIPLSLAFACCHLADASPHVFAAQEAQGTRLLKGFLNALNRKDTAEIKQFILTAFAPPSPKSPSTQMRIERLSELAKDKAPFTLMEVLAETPESIVALVKDGEGQHVGVKIEMEAQPPHRILRVMFGDPEALKGERPRKEYTQWKTLQELLQAIQLDNQAPGMSLAMVRNGEVVEQAVVGVREQGKPARIEINDLWHVGSVGKPMTATLIALLIDAGVLRWHTTLGEALPMWKMREEYRKVTLEQIMQHRGGLPQDMNYTRDYVELVTKNAKTPTAIRAAYLADVLTREPSAKPGERMRYSNAGYALLGHIAEVKMGKPYEVLMRERVFLPLKMTTARVGGEWGSNQPQGHILAPEGLQVTNIVGALTIMTAPSGNIRCSIGDFARFAAFHLRGLQGKGSLLKPQTFQRLHTPAKASPSAELYACGWEIVPNFTPEPFHGHSGSNGTFRAQLAIFPKQGLAIVSMMNVGGERDPSPTLQAVLSVEKRFRGRK